MSDENTPTDADVTDEGVAGADVTDGSSPGPGDELDRGPYVDGFSSRTVAGAFFVTNLGLVAWFSTATPFCLVFVLLAFMFALLICQDERMWTLMVWLYQLQQRSGPGVIYASLLIAAVTRLVLQSAVVAYAISVRSKA